jgi:hypothetical protein
MFLKTMQWHGNGPFTISKREHFFEKGPLERRCYCLVMQ